jgi:hypothetical protein
MLDLVVPWGYSSLDIHDSSLLCPTLQDAVKDTHKTWKRQMDLKMQEVINSLELKDEGETITSIPTKVPGHEKDNPKRGKRPRSPETIAQESEQFATKDQILALENEVQGMRVRLKQLQDQLALAYNSLPIFLRQQIQRDLDEVCSRFSGVVKLRESAFRKALESVRNTAAVTIADEVARVKGVLEKQMQARERLLLQRLHASQDAAHKANAALTSDRDMREAEIHRLRSLIDRSNSKEVKASRYSLVRWSRW